jgi:hypothetical protein
LLVKIAHFQKNTLINFIQLLDTLYETVDENEGDVLSMIMAHTVERGLAVVLPQAVLRNALLGFGEDGQVEQEVRAF